MVYELIIKLIQLINHLICDDIYYVKSLQN